MDSWRVHRVTTADAARMRALRLEMLADSPLAFLETLAQAAARPHEDYRRRLAQSAAGARDNGDAVREADGHRRKSPNRLARKRAG